MRTLRERPRLRQRLISGRALGRDGCGRRSAFWPSAKQDASAANWERTPAYLAPSAGRLSSGNRHLAAGLAEGRGAGAPDGARASVRYGTVLAFGNLWRPGMTPQGGKTIG